MLQIIQDLPSDYKYALLNKQLEQVDKEDEKRYLQININININSQINSDLETSQINQLNEINHLKNEIIELKTEIVEINQLKNEILQLKNKDNIYQTEIVELNQLKTEIVKLEKNNNNTILKLIISFVVIFYSFHNF